MGAQQGKEAAGGRPGGGGALPPGPPLPGGQPPMAGRMGERQGSRIKGLRPPKQRMGAGGNIFTEHSGEYSSTASIRKYNAHCPYCESELRKADKSRNLLFENISSTYHGTMEQEYFYLIPDIHYQFQFI